MKTLLGYIIAPVALLWALAAPSLHSQDAKPAGGPPEKAAAVARGETAVVPFEMLASNHMVVQAKLNGKGPYRFIFDLGAPVTLLTNRAAEASGAVDKNAPRSIFMGTRGEGKVENFEMGSLKADKLPVVVMDHPALTALSSGLFSKPLDGILGYTFWAHYKLTIDYQSRKMTFTPVDFEVRNLMQDLPQKMTGPKVARSIVLAPHGFWGLSLGDPEGGIDSPGVPIKAVLEGSPAQIAGIRAGDVLSTLDGRWTSTIADVYSAAAGVDPGKPVTVVVLRDGVEVAVQVTPREGI